MMTSNSMRFILFLTIFQLWQPCSVCSKDIATVGTTYPILEKDALSEIEDSAAQINWKDKINPDVMGKKIKSFRPKDMRKLKRAEKNRKFTVDMTYTLEFDIPDGKGGILYPKGYRYNPLEYMFYPKVLVVINGDDKEQVEWFKSSQYYRDRRIKLLLSGGSFYDLALELKRPAYYLSAALADKFNLCSAPSVIFQNGRVMEVWEIAVEISQ
jgi:conjugal transfer pilus assembly protein TraW